VVTHDTSIPAIPAFKIRLSYQNQYNMPRHKII